MGTLGRAAQWLPLFRFCCWLPLVLLVILTDHTHLLFTRRSCLVDPSLTLTSRHYLGPAFHHFEPEIDLPLVSGRFKLKHHYHDGLEEVLDAYDVPREDIESIRDATIITSIEVEDDFISISTSDADNPDQENVVSFVPGDLVEISNPLNGETVEFVATVPIPTMIQTRSEGVDSGTIEVKTWTFMPEGATVRTEVLRDNQLYPVVSEQVMARVDRNNRDRSLVLGWHK